MARPLNNPKKQKSNKLSPISLGYLSKSGSWKSSHTVRLRILFDTGCEGTLISHKVSNGLKMTESDPIKWVTKAGTFTSDSRCQLELKLPAFHENKVIHWEAFVEPTSNDLGKYDLIIGRDLMHEIGLDILFSKEKMVWDNASVSMQHSSFLDEDRWVDLLENELMQSHDPITTDAERIQQIIDAKYSKADLDQLVKELTHLKPIERDMLLKLLLKFEHLFDGSLGTWNTEPVDLHLKDPNAPPFHARPYPVPQSEERKLREEVKRLVEKGVLRRINHSEWASPMFTILKPDGTLRSLADLREINKRIRRTPYPLPRITEIL